MKNSLSNFDTPKHRYLNVGCGRRYHRDWVNLDLESFDPAVICHDLTGGIPFEESSFEAVYHSHVLEHLSPEQGQELIGECFRVLKPGGVLRVVVPDLERIAQLYLNMHESAWAGDEASQIDYNWMKLELLDQLVREKSGGRMGRYMASREIKNSEFVRSRVGDEMVACRVQQISESNQSWLGKIGTATFEFRKRMARRFVRWTMGRNAESAFDEGLFRSQGEIHRWMYDRFSLREVCRKSGFRDFQVREANESYIPEYQQFELDASGSQIRKPDSIFIECIKPVGKIASNVAA